MSSEEQQELDALEIEFISAQQSPNPPEVGDSPRSPRVSPILGCDQDELQVAEEPAAMETGDPNTTDDDSDPFKSEGLISYQILVSDMKEFASSMSSQRLSPPVFIRDLPWRLLIMPRESTSKDNPERVKCLGVFVQCNPKGPDVPGGWTCLAQANIRLINQTDSANTISKNISHCFCSKENDWGYSNLATLEEILDQEKGFIAGDCITLEAHIIADAPHGINWDSKKHTGYVGLKNQGATCYMNSLLQTLYFTNELRRAVYLMPTEHDDLVKSVPLAMQRIFYELQHSDKAVGTKKLTKSFGWDTMDVFMQHDVQEMSRVLLDNLEMKMKGTAVEGTIPQLFEGQMESYVRCTNVDYRSSRQETFFDIQLSIKGKKDVFESFRDYVAEETLDGENKYDAGEFGLQEAKKGVIFTKMPPVMHLHLMRFLYDPATDSNIKVNDRYEFPEHMDLSEFVKGPQEAPPLYTLHAVLVHSGDNYGGHYVAHLDPKGDGKWFKFDDDVVSRCSKKEAVNYNFGGSDEGGIIRSCTSAYMLVYVRDSHLEEVLVDVLSEDIPEHLKARVAEEKRIEAQKRKDRNEALLYFSVEVYRDDDFQQHTGPDLISDNPPTTTFKVLKTDSLEVFKSDLAEALGHPPDHIRMWPFERRSNSTLRPGPLDEADNPQRTVFDHAEKSATWRIYVEVLEADSECDVLPGFNPRNDVLLFYKYYNPKTKSLSFVRHSVECVDRKFCDLFPMLREDVGLDPDVPLYMFEEVKPNMIEQINSSHYLRQLEDIRDGDIICFQRADIFIDDYDLPTVEDYFRDLYNRVEVTFCNRVDPSDIGFTLVLNQKMNYAQVARATADYLREDPGYIQFFKPSHIRNTPEVPIRWHQEGCLRDFMLMRHRMDLPAVLYYQMLSIPVVEFESKKCFRCIFVNRKLREERDLTVYVNKQGLVADLLQEAAKELQGMQVEIMPAKLRLVEVLSHRIFDIYPASKPVNEVGGNRTLRLEEIQPDHFHIGSDEALIPVAHFSKEPHNTFGIPFLIKLTDGERLSSLRERIQKLLDVPEKDMDKWKFSLVHQVTQARYLSDEKDEQLFIQYFMINKERGIHFPHMGIPYLGLDHVNKNPKRARFAYLEKAIKIHN